VNGLVRDKALAFERKFTRSGPSPKGWRWRVRSGRLPMAVARRPPPHGREDLSQIGVPTGSVVVTAEDTRRTNRA